MLVAGEQGKQKPSDSWVRSGTAGSTGAPREVRVLNPAMTEQGRLFRGGEAQSGPEEYIGVPQEMCVL